MSSQWSSPQASIEHLTLRYRGTAADANVPALRLRMERLLRNIDLQPSGLPPGALLIVRKLHSLQDSLPLFTAALSQAQWASHLRTQIAILYRTAARPALNPVAPDVASVLFADAAEMLACLTRDLLDGHVWQRWYWQQMLRHVPPTPAAALTAVWSEQAAFVPAMLSYLRIEEAQAAIALLTPTDVSKLISTLNSSFDLRSPSPTSLAAAAAQQSNPSSDALSFEPDLPAVEQTLEEISPTLPPWQRWLSSSPATTLTGLTPQAEYLLGLIVTLHYAPAFARSASFVTQVVSWLGNQFLNLPISGKALSEASVRNAPLHDAVETSFVDKEGSQISAEEVSNPINSGAPEMASQVTHPAQATTPNDVMFATAQPFPAEGVPTELGGILYLVNLLTWLDLPEAWATDGTLAEYLSGWALVEALARGLLGATYDDYADDPFWGVLAMLDGRESGALIGADLPPQTAFRLPATWLQRYGPAKPSWIAVTDGLRLQLADEDAGYLIVDVPLLGRSLDEAIATEVNAYRAQGIVVAGGWETPTMGDRKGSSMVDPDLRDDGCVSQIPTRKSPTPQGDHHPASFLSESTTRWLQRVLGFVYHLLIRALNDPTIDPHSLAENLLCKRGRLVAGRTHIDLYMPMEQISLPIRRAGLDRDPSWVPNLGRIVLFHFGQEI